MAQQVLSEKNREQLVQIIREVNGLPCWRADLAFGELHLHLGERVAYQNRKMAGAHQGEWILVIVGADWEVIGPDGQGVQSTDPDHERIAQGISALQGTVVREVIPDETGALCVVFSNGARLHARVAGADQELPYWELFTPYQTLLLMEPGPSWSLIPSSRRPQ